jgi:ABC-type uncharacterized transport system, permease component
MVVKKIKYYVPLFLAYVRKNFVEAVSFKFDFLFGIGSNVIQQVVMIAFLSIVFQNPVSIEGWGYNEFLFLYGFALIPNGISDLVFGNIWALPGHYIHFGNLDKVLVRPVATLFAVIADGTNLHGFIQSVVGGIICIIAGIELNLSFSIFSLLYMILLTVCGAFIIMSINLVAATLAFWFNEVMSFMILISSFKDFLKYPLGIYHKSIQILCTWLIPYAFVSYFPTTYILEMKEYVVFVMAAPFVSIIFFVFAINFFKFGLKHYTSVNSK